MSTLRIVFSPYVYYSILLLVNRCLAIKYLLARRSHEVLPSAFSKTIADLQYSEWIASFL